MTKAPSSDPQPFAEKSETSLEYSLTQLTLLKYIYTFSNHGRRS